MNGLLHAITPWCAAAAEALITATWQGLILAAGVATCLRLLPGLGAARRSLLWMVAFLFVLLLHFAPLAAPLHGAGAKAPLHISMGWSLAVVCAWGTLSLYRAARLAWSAWRLHRIAMMATPVDCTDACAALLLSGRRPALLCISAEIDRPSVIGFHSPRILLPSHLLASLSAADMEQILLHETEHLRRADDWTNLLQKLALVFFPLNPVLLWIERHLCRERELACDDAVLSRTHARKAYAACLTRLAEQTILRSGASLALSAWEKQSELSQRVFRILRQPEPSMRGRRSGAAASLVALALLAGAGGLARTPALVRFVPAFTPQPTQASLVQDTLLASSPRAPGAHVAQVSMVSHTLPVNASPPAAHLARAVLVRPRRHAAATASRNRMNHLKVPATLREAAYQPALPNAPWLLLTGWPQADQPAGATLPFHNAVLSYAAVPVGDGWLIIQL